MKAPYRVTLTSDGQTDAYLTHRDTTHLSIDGTIGGGTVHLEKLRNGAWVPVYDSGSGSAITYIAVTDQALDVGIEETLRMRLTGATAPSLTLGFN